MYCSSELTTVCGDIEVTTNMKAVAVSGEKKRPFVALFFVGPTVKLCQIFYNEYSV